MSSWLYRKTKHLLGIRWTVSKSKGRKPRLTGSKRIWPFSFNTRGDVRLSAFGFQKLLRKGDR